MFLGTFELNFSGRGRIILPKKIRDEFKDQVIILTRGLDGGIWGYRRADWEELVKTQLEVSVIEEKGRNLRRILFSGADVAKLDAQGRFVIPSALLLASKLGGEVTLIGAGDHLEIWDPQSFKKLMVRLGKRTL